MNSVAWVIVIAIAAVAVISLKKSDNVQRQVDVTPNTVGGSQPDSPAETFKDLADGISKLINAGTSIAAQIDRNGASTA